MLHDQISDKEAILVLAKHGPDAPALECVGWKQWQRIQHMIEAIEHFLSLGFTPQRIGQMLLFTEAYARYEDTVVYGNMAGPYRRRNAS